AAVLAGEYEVVTGVLAPGLNQVLRLGDVHDRNYTAKLGERIGAAREGVAADGVEDHIDAVAIGIPQDGLNVILLLVVDDHVGAQTPGELEVRFAHGGKDPGADGFCHLDRDMADTAGAAVDQNAFPDPE